MPLSSLCCPDMKQTQRGMGLRPALLFSNRIILHKMETEGVCYKLASLVGDYRQVKPAFLSNLVSVFTETKNLSDMGVLNQR